MSESSQQGHLTILNFRFDGLLKNSTVVHGERKRCRPTLNAPISGIEIPEELVEFTSILTQMHKLE